jgi:hypothetical protein
METNVGGPDNRPAAAVDPPPQGQQQQANVDDDGRPTFAQILQQLQQQQQQQQQLQQTVLQQQQQIAQLLQQPPSTAGHRYIFTAIDYFTRWPIAAPYQSADTETLLDFLRTYVLAQLGVPKVVITDRGSIFTDKLIGKMFAHLGIQHRPTTAYRPQANGRVERMHRTMNQQLAKFTTEDRNTWNLEIWRSLMAMRSARNESTQYSPFELMHGFRMTVPSTWALDRGTLSGQDEATEAENIAARMEQIKNQLQDLRDRASFNSSKSQQRQAQYYNATVKRQASYQTNDLVWKIIPNKGSTATSRNKFSEWYEGPYTVVHQNKNGTYVIKDPEGNTDTVHVETLAHAKIREHLIPEVMASAKPITKGLARYRRTE